MNLLFQQKITSRNSKNQLIIKDAIIALGWALLIGLPLFIVHMVLFDFEHSQHMEESYSFVQSLITSVPHHPISLSLWLSAIFVATFAIRRPGGAVLPRARLEAGPRGLQAAHGLRAQRRLQIRIPLAEIGRAHV